MGCWTASWLVRAVLRGLVGPGARVGRRPRQVGIPGGAKLPWSVASPAPLPALLVLCVVLVVCVCVGGGAILCDRRRRSSALGSDTSCSARRTTSGCVRPRGGWLIVLPEQRSAGACHLSPTDTLLLMTPPPPPPLLLSDDPPPRRLPSAISSARAGERRHGADIRARTGRT